MIPPHPPMQADEEGHLPMSFEKWLEVGFGHFPLALRINADPVSMVHISRVVKRFLRDYKIRFHILGQGFVNVSEGAPKALLRIDGPLTDILLRQSIPPEILLLEEKEVTTKQIHYSPCMLLALQAWNYLAEKELRLAEAEGRLFRCAVYSRSPNSAWVDSPPPLPYCMLEDAYGLLKDEVSGHAFKTLGPPMERINDAQLEVGDEGRRCLIWTQGSPEIKNVTRKGFNVLWADLIVGNKKVSDGVVPPNVRVAHEPDPELVDILRRFLRTRENKPDPDYDANMGDHEAKRVLTNPDKKAPEDVAIGNEDVEMKDEEKSRRAALVPAKRVAGVVAGVAKKVRRSHDKD